MSKKRVENYIPKALEVLEKKFKDSIPSEYNGYISSFGASLIQSGLKATVALFENKNSQSKSDKEILTEIILEILDEKSKEKSLLRYIIESKKDERVLKEEIKDISIAIKLALRTFELKDS